jgi:hypothetical protein
MRPKYLLISVAPRYQEDAVVNGVQEPEYGPPRMPGLQNGVWEVCIDLDLGRVAYWPVGVTAVLYYKVCEEGTYSLLAYDGSPIRTISGYVPDWVSAKGRGDYLLLTIGPNGKVYEYGGYDPDLALLVPWQLGRLDVEAESIGPITFI